MLVVDLDDVKVHLAMAPVAVMLNLRADALRGSRAAHCLSTNWCYSSPIDIATRHTGRSPVSGAKNAPKARIVPLLLHGSQITEKHFVVLLF